MRLLDLDAFLPYRLAVTAHNVSRGLWRVYERRFGLSIPEWRVIAHLGRQGPLGAGVLALRASMDKPKVTRAIQRLEARGLLRRIVADEDRRRATLDLTAEGRRIFREIAAAALAWEADLLSGLEAHERAALLAALDRLDERLAAAAGAATKASRR
jgi:DNA-binding MarR family transcriptional regulator